MRSAFGAGWEVGEVGVGVEVELVADLRERRHGQGLQAGVRADAEVVVAADVLSPGKALGKDRYRQRQSKYCRYPFNNAHGVYLQTGLVGLAF